MNVRSQTTGFASFTVIVFWVHAAAAAEVHQQAHQRRPLALTIADRLYVANGRSGSVSVIDLKTHRVIGEYPVGQRLSDLVRLGDGRMLATDPQRAELILLAGDELRVRQRLPISTHPVSIVASRDGSLCCVSSLWSRRLTFVDIAPDRPATAGQLAIAKTIDLPFAPRLQWLSPDEKTLIVADAFGGRLGIIDVLRQKLIAVRSIETHNIGGLAASADGQELLIAHQLLNDQVPTVRERIFWGAVVSNILRSVTLDELLAPVEDGPSGWATAKPIGHWSLVPLGQPKEGAGDPGELLITTEGKAIVALSGVDQVAVQFEGRGSFTRFQVGRRPIALALGPAERFLYVANTLGNSITVIDLVNRQTLTTISLGATPQPTLVDRGESLFFDARLALDGWYSCHSCHTNGHSNGLLNDNFGDDSSGAPKRVLTLLGVARTKPWAWNRARETLAAQIHKSFETTMRATDGVSSDDSVKAIEAYLETLKPPPSLSRARDNVDRRAAAHGRQVFADRGCVDCHTPPTYTSAATYDVNLRDEAGQSEFNPPSLLGASQRTEFFHDNRAKGLRDVFTRYGHPDSHQFSERQLDDLLEFLRSL